MNFLPFLRWKFDNRIFFNRIDCLKQSALTGRRSSFVLGSDDIWKTTIPTNFNLEDLYRQRAEILREKYKKIRIYFSGGSDSYNILNTFIKNNILIDEIVVRWSNDSIDGRFHHSNIFNNHASNSLFEWDYAIKPTLDQISKHYPNIKITIEDITTVKIADKEKYTVKNILSVIEKNSFMRGTLGSVLQRIGRGDEVFDFTESVANVFGVEKPILFYINGEFYFAFNDLSFEMFSGHTSSVPEPFYWSVDFPELAIAQACVLALHYKTNAHLLPNLLSELYDINGAQKIHNQNLIAKSVLYKNWNSKTFQASKPNFYRDDWWGWLEKKLPVSELEINQAYTIATNEFHSDYIKNNSHMRKPFDNKDKPRPYLPNAIFSDLYKINL